MAGEKIELPIGVPVDTNAPAAAGAIESLRDQIEGSTADIKAMSASLRQLRGSSDEVKAAKAQLTTKIDSLKNSVSGATLALVKQGTSYDAAASARRNSRTSRRSWVAELKSDALAKQKERTIAFSSAISQAGGPVASLKGKLDGLKSVLGETGGAGGMGLLTLGAATAVAAVAALTIAVVAGVVAVSKFILTSANAARSAGLLREAWSGTAANAANLGTQIDELANKVPTSKEKLNELAIALMKTKLGGQATVDAFNAVGQASAALGDEAGAKIKEFIERMRVMGRMQIDPREMLEGFGNLNFDDVAKALAKNTGKSVEAARNELRLGKTKLADGAKAMRDAIEEKFGGLNLRKMMSFEVIAEKFHEKLAGLTKGVSLEPLLKPLAQLGKLFDDSTVTGQTLKLLVTAFGNTMVSSLTAAIPIGKALFQGLVVGALRVYIEYLRIRNALRAAFGDSQVTANVNLLALSFEAGKVSLVGFSIALGMVGKGAAVGITGVMMLVRGVQSAVDLFSTVGTSIAAAFTGLDWKSLGRAIPDGILEGIRGGAADVIAGVGDLAKGAEKKFRSALGSTLRRASSERSERAFPRVRRMASRKAHRRHRPRRRRWSMPRISWRGRRSWWRRRRSRGPHPHSHDARRWRRGGRARNHRVLLHGEDPQGDRGREPRGGHRVMALTATPFIGFPKQSYIVLGAMQSPGVATVRGLSTPREWDIRQGYGFTGAVVVYKGTSLAPFTVDIDLWLPEHFLMWNVFATVLVPPLPGPAGFALGIKHPIVNGPPHGITEVVVKDCSEPVQNDTGKWTYTLTLLPYKKPIPALARPIAAIPAAGVPMPTAQSNAELEMQKLAAEAKALGASKCRSSSTSCRRQGFGSGRRTAASGSPMSTSSSTRRRSCRSVRWF